MGRRSKNKAYNEEIMYHTRELLLSYNSVKFSITLCTFIMSLPRKKLKEVLLINEELVLEDRIPSRIAMLVRDLVSYRNRVSSNSNNSSVDKINNSGIYFHNKGIDMINLPTILHSKRVRATIPTYLNNVNPPIVSYTYPETIARRVFNFNKPLKTWILRLVPVICLVTVIIHH